MNKRQMKELEAQLLKLKNIAGNRVIDEGLDWIAIDSKALGETVIWCVRESPMVPRKYKDCVVYGASEVNLLVDRSRPITTEGMKTLHVIKREFGGEITVDDIA